MRYLVIVASALAILALPAAAQQTTAPKSPPDKLAAKPITTKHKTAHRRTYRAGTRAWAAKCDPWAYKNLGVCW